MTRPNRLSIAALVSDGERLAVELGAAHIARALGEAAGIPWEVDVLYASRWDDLPRGDEARVFVTSFLPELGTSGETWPVSVARMRAAYGALAETGMPVFICTIFRHVARTDEPESDSALRLRIRRFNLLAAEISRETRALSSTSTACWPTSAPEACKRTIA